MNCEVLPSRALSTSSNALPYVPQAHSRYFADQFAILHNVVLGILVHVMISVDCASSGYPLGCLPSRAALLLLHIADGCRGSFSKTTC